MSDDPADRPDGTGVWGEDAWDSVRVLVCNENLTPYEARHLAAFLEATAFTIESRDPTAPVFPPGIPSE